jgi:signal transduction histidine kinase
MASAAHIDEERVLVVAPTARDARLTQALFSGAGLGCAICQDLTALSAELARGAGVLVLTEEALAGERQPLLRAALGTQPTWSDLPIILLASTGPRQVLSAPLVQELGNVLVLERPIATRTLLQVVQIALRTRRRQYHARLVSQIGELLAGSLGNDDVLAEAAALCVPRLADCCVVATYDMGEMRVSALVTTPDELHPHTFRELPEVAPLPAGATATGWLEQRLDDLGATTRVVVGLRSQGRTVGALGMAMLTSGRAFSQHDRQIVQDLAERVALALGQVQLYRAEQSARAVAEAAVQARDELVALISHDLNNPLTAVLGQAQLLKRQLAAETLSRERLSRGVEQVERAARQMQAQIVELLDTARLRAGQPLKMRREATDLVALAQQAVARIQETTERHTIRVQTSLSSLVAPVDPLRIGRVLDNLLSNAVKYSPNGGTITATLDAEYDGTASWAVVQVHDQGVGIPEADLPHIFDHFRRAANVMGTTHGTGLGLVSARQIVEQHGGQIAVASAVGAGSTFTVRLPEVVALTQPASAGQ